MTDILRQFSASSFAPPRRAALSRLERFFAHLGGVNPDRLETGPLDDRQAAARTGLALATSFLFVAYASANAIAIAFGDSLAIIIAGQLSALLIATAIILVDHAMIQSHWMEAGLAAARRRGFAPVGGTGPFAALGRYSRWLTVGAVRFGLSLSLAFTIATIVELQIFHSDIKAQIAADQRAANAPILARAESAVQARVDAAGAEVSRLGASLSTAEARADALARTVADEAAALGAAREAQIGQLERQRDAADQLAYSASRVRTAEQYGALINGAGTGKAGKGPQYRYNEDDARLAAERAVKLAAEIAGLRQAPPPRGPDADPLDAALAQVATLRAAHDQAVAERDRRTGSRSADIQAALVADPAYAPIADGLVTRLGAMRKLEASPAVFTFTLAIKALLMSVEMAGLLAKLMLAAPGRYGLYQALDFEGEAADAIEAASERIDAFADGVDRREERAEERRESRDAHRRRRHVAAGARKRFASVLRDAMDGTDRP
ncbi:MAG: DUF4407 domain-containing protein [Roseiarcus sp.]|jgi:hypothetical protein